LQGQQGLFGPARSHQDLAVGEMAAGGHRAGVVERGKRGRKKMTSGAGVSVRASERAGRLVGPRADGPSERVSAWMGRAFCWVEPKEKEKSARAAVLFFFFKNMNSMGFVYFTRIFIELQK
jgi:hypothetical protein